jgi:hypothetical protein
VFIGHFALAFAVKKVEPRVSLATMFLAAQLADTIWPILLIAGVERATISPGATAVTPLRFDSYPWSHSLLMLIVYGVVFGAIHYRARRQVRAALLLGLLVVSHWILDYVTHAPDMPLSPWTSGTYGLGLWNSVAATVAVEVVMFAVGLSLALSATRGRDRIGRWGLAAFVAFLILVFIANLYSPPPPSMQVVGWMSLVLPCVLLPIVAWIDRHREPA